MSSAYCEACIDQAHLKWRIVDSVLAGLTNTVQALECASLAGLAPELVRASGSPSMQLVATATGFAVASGDPGKGMVCSQYASCGWKRA